MASPPPNSPARVPLLQGRTVESTWTSCVKPSTGTHQVSKVVFDREDERRVKLVAIRVERSRRFWPGS